MSRPTVYGLLCAVCGLVAVIALGRFGPSEAAPAASQKADPLVAPSVECRWATGPIKIDGTLDEPAWGKADVLDKFAVYWQHRPAKTATKARLLWDDNYLYFAAEMDDSDLYADVTQRNGMTWTNDVFELFFKPVEIKLAYYELQVNAANTQLELFFPSRGSGGYQRFAPLTKLGMESAVKLDGTLNNPADKDRGWTVEGRIPLSAFLSSGDTPKPGAKWRFALCRYDYSVDFDRVETSSTAPLTQPDFHRYEDYEQLIFVGR